MATDAVQAQIDLLKLDAERKDRELAAQVAIANAQQALNERILNEYQLGTLTEAKRAALVDEAMKQANQTFSQNMAMKQFGLDQAATTGYYQGTPTQKTIQAERQDILNAPRGPADYAAYINRLRGLAGQGMLPGIIGQLFAGQNIASMSNGGQATPTPATNTDLAFALVNASRNLAGNNAYAQPPGNTPTTNFLLPQGPAQRDPHDPSKFLYQQYMIDPLRPELGYQQPTWAGNPQPYTSSVPPGAVPPPPPPPPAPPTPPAGYQWIDPNNPSAGIRPIAQTPAPTPTTDQTQPQTPAGPTGHWEVNGPDDSHYTNWLEWVQDNRNVPWQPPAQPSVDPASYQVGAQIPYTPAQAQPQILQSVAPTPAPIPPGYTLIDPMHPEYGYRPTAQNQPSSLFETGHSNGNTYADPHSALVPPGQETAASPQTNIFSDTPSSSGDTGQNNPSSYTTATTGANGQTTYGLNQDAVRNMFSNVFSNEQPTIPLGRDVSYQQFLKLSPTEQAYTVGLAQEGSDNSTPQTAEDFLATMKESAPQFQSSPGAKFYGLQ